MDSDLPIFRIWCVDAVTWWCVSCAMWPLGCLSYDMWVSMALADGLMPMKTTPDRKVHGANMGPTWVLSAPDGPHVGLMNLAIWDCNHRVDPGELTTCTVHLMIYTLCLRFVVVRYWLMLPTPFTFAALGKSVGNHAREVNRKKMGKVHYNDVTVYTKAS